MWTVFKENSLLIPRSVLLYIILLVSIILLGVSALSLFALSSFLTIFDDSCSNGLELKFLLSILKY